MPNLEEQRVTGPGEGRTLFVPPMDPCGARLLAAVFRSVGYEAYVLEENAETLAIGHKHTSGGECVPCPLTVGALVKAMQDRKLPPERVIFFMPTACGPCRFGQYAKLDSIIFEKQGWGGIRILSPSAENAYAGLDSGARMRLWHAAVVGDILRKLGMKVRPYEQRPGETDVTLEQGLRRLEKAFEQKDVGPVTPLLAGLVDEVARVARRPEKRPLVGVVGEIYVRCDPFINGQVCRRIEELGGEAWLAPVSEWILYTNYLQTLVASSTSGLRARLENLRTWLERNLFFEKWEHHYYEVAEPVLHDRKEHSIAEVIQAGAKYLPWQFEGEAILTLGRAVLFVRRDGARAVVNASPMFCMPGTITTSIFPQVERETGAPMVCLFYDGSGDPNQALVPVMHYLREPGPADVPQGRP
ncbi:MAG TPA: hypothetical protein P5567_04145 [Kiritimatiellia bacterium]|nr:hypothetical protein [Kiritimatiellia bacterium]HRZ11628.1 hypothetical protein [Kiritimatiellia bacterium]HSA16821.1 hypothetical protein [Kiritimatiellia bacterium]